MAVYGLQADQELNKGSKLYVPGQTKMNAGDVFLGGTGTGVTDDMLNGATRIWGNDRLGTQQAYSDYQSGQNSQSITPPPAPTPTPTPPPPPDYTALMKQSLADQQAAQATMYNQQATDQAAKIRQALASQSQQADATKADYTNQMNAAIGTLNTERAKIPGQTTTFNNAASFQGMNNERNVRNSLAQMGLLQSGESGTQQLINDVGTANRINANNLQGQQLDTNFGNQIASSQTDLASKIKAVNDAIAIAQANGDENALAALTYAQNQIALSAAQNNTTMNNFQYQASRNAEANNQWQQTFDANNAFNEGQLTGYYGGVHYVNGVAQTPTTSNDTYGFQADVDANPGKNVQLYVPGQTQLGAGDVFLGGPAVLGKDKLNGATRIWGADRYETAKEYTEYLTRQNSQPVQANQQTSTAPTALPSSIASMFPGATNVTKDANGNYNFTSANGGKVIYGG